MKEVILTASVLILAMILFRFLFRTAIPRRVQYALWALVLVRLLVPVQVPDLPIVSVLEVSQQAGQQLTAALERPVALAPVRVQTAEMTAQPVTEQAPDNAQTQVFETRPSVGETGAALPASTVSPARVLDVVWKAGMAAMAAFFLMANLRFRLALNRSRVPFPVAGCPLPVYLSDRLSSPCLVGLVRPAIYLTPAAVRCGHLEYVLLHERTHARQLDPLWAVLRCVCLTIYWFHPLVWAAALLSRTDCELACDEGAMAALDRDRRLAYGRTLLALVPVSGRPANPLLATTTMASGRRQLKDRITRIAHHKRPVLAAVLAAVLLAGLVGACTFAGPNTAVYESGTFTLSLSHLTPYTAPVFQPSPDDRAFSAFCAGVDSFRAGDGSVYPALASASTDDSIPWIKHTDAPVLSMQSTQYDSGQGLRNTYQSYCYSGLFGTCGLISVYPGILPEQQEDWVYDFFAMDEERGQLYLLLRACGTAGGQLLTQDLNGDGSYELFTDRQLILQREDTLCAVDYAGLLAQYWPAFRTLEEARLAAGGSCILLSGTMEDPKGQTASFLRTLTLSGDTLTVAQPAIGTEGSVTLPLEALAVYQELSDPAPTSWSSSTGYGDNYSDDFRFGINAQEDGSCSPYLSLDSDDVAPAFDRFPQGIVNGDRFLDDFPALLGYEGLLVGWSSDPVLDGAPTCWTIDLYRWNQAEGLVRFLRAESTLQQSVRIVDLDGDGDCELVTDKQLFFRRDGTIYTVAYADLLKAYWPAFFHLDTVIADPLEHRLVLAGVCRDGTGGTAPFLHTLTLSGDGLTLTRPDTDGPVAIPTEALAVYQPENSPVPPPEEGRRLLGTTSPDQLSAGIYQGGDHSLYPGLTPLSPDGAVAADLLAQIRLAGSGMTMEGFTGLLGQVGVLTTWADGSSGSDVVGLYRWSQEEGLVRFLQAEKSHYANASSLDLDGDGDCELVTDKQLFFCRGETIYAVAYADLLKAYWPAFRSLDTAAADPLEGCVVLTGTCADEDGNAVSFRRYLELEASGLILHD